MTRIPRTATRFALALLSLAFLPGAVSADEPLVGVYNTDYGPVAIYSANNGNFAGTYYYKGLPAHLFLRPGPDGFYDGHWIQGTSEVRCSSLHNGGPYWGRVRMRFTGERVLSLWNYCDRALKNTKNLRWTGQYRN